MANNEEDAMYKSFYYKFFGLSEPVRFLLHYCGIKFEDKWTPYKGRPNVKLITPLDKVPILEVGGRYFTYSKAIGRFVAKKGNLYGANDMEAYEIDATIDIFDDMRLDVTGAYKIESPEQKEEWRAEAVAKIPDTLQKINEQIKKNGGFLVGKKLSWADIQITAQLEVVNRLLDTELENDYPEIKKLVTNVRSLPRIKAYLENRSHRWFLMVLNLDL